MSVIAFHSGRDEVMVRLKVRKSRGERVQSSDSVKWERHVSDTISPRERRSLGPFRGPLVSRTNGFSSRTRPGGEDTSLSSREI